MRDARFGIQDSGFRFVGRQPCATSGLRTSLGGYTNHQQMKQRTLSVLILALLAAIAPTAEHRIQRGDVSLFYETEGKGDPVILLAGGPGVSPYSVKPVMDYVSSKHMAVLIHQRGTGKTVLPSTGKDHLSLQIFIDDIDAVRKDLRVDKITLVGHSWGGMLAMAYAGAHPDRVSHIILMGSGGPNLSFAPIFGDNINMHLLPEDRELQKRADADANGDAELAAYNRLMAIIPGYFYSRDNAIEFSKSFKPTDYTTKLMTLLSGFDITSSVPKYKGPVDILQGRQDPIDANTVALNLKYLPQAKVHWIERAGHFPWLEQPADFQKTISEILK
jgi:proline iminopeptidase